MSTKHNSSSSSSKPKKTIHINLLQSCNMLRACRMYPLYHSNEPIRRFSHHKVLIDIRTNHFSNVVIRIFSARMQSKHTLIGHRAGAEKIWESTNRNSSTSTQYIGSIQNDSNREKIDATWFLKHTHHCEDRVYVFRTNIVVGCKQTKVQIRKTKW